MSDTPLWKKLAVRSGDTVVLINRPATFSLADLPDGVSAAEEASKKPGQQSPDTVIAFFRTLADLRETVPVLGQRIFPAAALWIAWPRRAAGHRSDITENHIRSVALPLGLVDVKVAALGEDWSGLRLVWRVERRRTSSASPG
jgi:hypothetical protein